jgi:hypothetical protein
LKPSYIFAKWLKNIYIKIPLSLFGRWAMVGHTIAFYNPFLCVITDRETSLFIFISNVKGQAYFASSKYC